MGSVVKLWEYKSLEKFNKSRIFFLDLVTKRFSLKTEGPLYTVTPVKISNVDPSYHNNLR